MSSKKFDVTTKEVDDVVTKFSEWLKGRDESLEDFKSLIILAFASELAYSFKHKGFDLIDMFTVAYRSYSERVAQIKEV